VPLFRRKVSMKAKSVLLILAVLCFSAAASLAQQQGGGTPAPPPAPSAPPADAAGVGLGGGDSTDESGVKKYLLGPGDVLDLRVYSDQQFNGMYVINDEGAIEIPFIDKPIPAKCRTDREVKADVVKALEKYLVKPQISLHVAQMNSRPPAVVFGAVRAPQRVQMQRKARLLEILAFSGGVTEGAGANIQIFHPEPIMCPKEEEGEDISKPLASVDPKEATDIRYDLYSLADLKVGKPEANPVIHPGDIIIVPESSPVYVTGAVRQPTGLYLGDGMSLMRAIAMVGGLTPEAKGDSITIWRRKTGSVEPEKMVVNFNDIKKQKAKDIPLQAYDIIDVKDNSRSLTNTVRDMLRGGATNGIMGSVSTLPLRVLY
jgi:polysaccharide biosynthesis/export protein